MAREPRKTPEQAAAEAALRTKGQVALLKRQAKINAARENLLDYIEITMPDIEAPGDVTRSAYVSGRPHKAICAAVQTFVEGGFPGYDILILTVPPRHGKSEIVSRRLPAWFSGRFPDKNVVVATYGDEFAADFGAEVRRIVHSPAHKQVFPTHKLVRGGTAKDRLNTTAGGLMFFVGRGAALTGRGAHLLVIDDLIKDDKEASSQAIRDQAWNWLTRVAMTRRMGKHKPMILTFTRWHSDDPIGRLTDPENQFYRRELAERIKIINLPALAEENDPLGRAPGEALWPDGPDNYDEKFLHQFRVLDPMGFASLYQQRPTLAEGDLFKMEGVRLYDSLPENLRWYASSDHAVSLDQRRDPSCFGKAGVDKHGHLWLDELFWQRVASEVAVETMLSMGTGPRQPLIWWAERGHISKSLGPFLKKRMAETNRYFNVVEVTPIGDKASRAASAVARWNLGMIHLPASASWTERFIAELMAFPNGNHDDAVDMLSLMCLGLRVQVPASAPTAVKTEPKYGTLNWVRAQQKIHDAGARLRYGGF
jgi:predicted phage terminase large subunit-like protein